jgi:hypothetical protein
MVISPDDPFYSAKIRLQRAEEKISDLDTAIWEYRDKHPPSLICELDEPDRCTKTYKFKFSRPFPDSWTHLPIEILEATRSALDQCGYAAAKLSGNARLKKTQFPIADSFGELKNLISGRKVCDDIPPAVVAVFERFEPYHRGNGHTLWVLNKLRNSNHTQVIPVEILDATIGFNLSGSSKHTFKALNPIFNVTKFEIPFGRVSVDAEITFNAHPVPAIGFNQSITEDSRHAVTFLTAAVNEVQEVIEATEIACLRLGFL